ncbi:MAG: universal stress protein [Kofleriaceae bacterium]|nr:universal stress protein [Kofleriaceae bacterium]
MKKILCPVDFSAGSKQALRWAVRLATEADAELVVFHAWQTPAVAAEYAFAATMTAQLQEAAVQALAADLEAARSLGASRASSRLVNGPAWSMIVDEVAAGGFDIVVMGKHGRTGLKRFLIGSVAENVVRRASCPVLVVPTEREPTSFAKVLVPVDFSACSHAAMDAVPALVQPGGEGITLLHVIDLPVNYHGEPKIEGLMEAVDKRGTETLERWAGELRAKVSVPVTPRSRIGRAATESLAVLDELPAFDLVVVGSHGRTGLARALIGSVAEKIVRLAPCAVLVVRGHAGP